VKQYLLSGLIQAGFRASILADTKEDARKLLFIELSGRLEVMTEIGKPLPDQAMIEFIEVRYEKPVVERYE